jgi:hypothetical protein
MEDCSKSSWKIFQTPLFHLDVKEDALTDDVYTIEPIHKEETVGLKLYQEKATGNHQLVHQPQQEEMFPELTL